ncbi:AAA family ATPase [Deefgea piscis]|uniref:AAA family ATPase n=1 Tax=Deefgea piscis TaxID=2739061 RepID=UPI001C81934D|nr:AAA family ATPase [Deefgea piscis]QZA82264.1 TniB family NTP-binding protein [Deefgea piscis]
MRYVTAQYLEQRIPQYRGNPLIEALPPTIDEREFLKSLLCVPEFDVQQREWTIAERMQMLGQLGSFMMPLNRHVQLAQAIEMLIKQGYVGRAPRTAEFNAKLRKIYDLQQAGQSFSQSAGQITAQLSAAFLGMPGMGKTTTIKRILARYPEVIFHPELNFYQVPYLMVETPYDGASVKGLAESIFRKLDNLFPDANYGKTYGGNTRSGAETLMNHAARLIHMHGVGVLIVDEIQNLENSPKNRQALMTLLVSASNELGVPIIFVGTNKAKNLLSLDFRQARRSTGMGSVFWDSLVRGGHETPSEWEDFIRILWRYQWVKEPLQITSQLADLMYFHSQGIIDVAIKLFALSQARAIQDGSETLSSVLIDDVACKDMSMIQPMIEALRSKDRRALERCQDIAPLSLNSMMSDIGSTFSGHTIRAATITPADESFQTEVSDTLMGLGFDAKNAEIIASSNEVANSTNVLEAVSKAVTRGSSGRAISRRKNTKDAPELIKSYPIGDFRNAHNPDVAGTNHFERLKTLRILPDLDNILNI